jgi:hypothetical protein
MLDAFIFIVSWIAIGIVISVIYGLRKRNLITTLNGSIILGFLGPMALLLFFLD